MSDHSGEVHQQPTYVPPSPPKPKRRGLHPLAIVGIVLGSVLALCCIGGAVAMVVNSDGDEEDAATTDESPQPGDGDDERAVAGIGDPVRDGKFEFVVTEVETGVENVGDEFLSEEAQGQFVLVHMTVENIGDEAQTFDGSAQFLFDTEGREHSADTEAALYVENSESFFNEINPGNRVEGVVVFDIPADATPASMRLHDSLLSGGVEVMLTEG
jgi:hypothetical protein